MSEEEVKRSGVMSRLAKGELNRREAAELLGLSYRQIKRLDKSAPASAQAALWRTAAVGRQLPPLAGTTRASRLSVESGGRRNRRGHGFIHQR
jgi:hypothetical protein